MTLKHNVEDHDLHFTVDPVTRKIDSKTSGKACLMQYDHNSEVITFSLPVMIEGHCMAMADSIQVHYSNESKGTSSALRKTYRGITEITSTVAGLSDITYADTTWKFNTHPFANQDILELFDTDVFSIPVHFKMVDSDTIYDEIIFRRVKNSEASGDSGSLTGTYSMDENGSDSPSGGTTVTLNPFGVNGEWDYSITYKSSDESVLAYDSTFAQGWGPSDILSILTDYRSITFLDEPSFSDGVDKAYAWYHMWSNATLVDPVDSTPTFTVSWTVPENATMFAGALKFQLKFICHKDEEKHFEGYKWHTDVNEDISILPGLPNTEEDLPPSVTATLHSLEINEVKEGLEVILDGKTYRIYHGGYSDTVMDTVELKKNKTYLIDESSTHAQYPTAAAVRDFLNRYADEIKEDLQELNEAVEFKENKVSTIDENSTDLQYPTAAAVRTLNEATKSELNEATQTNVEAIQTNVKAIGENATAIEEHSTAIENNTKNIKSNTEAIESLLLKAPTYTVVASGPWSSYTSETGNCITRSNFIKPYTRYLLDIGGVLYEGLSNSDGTAIEVPIFEPDSTASFNGICYMKKASIAWKTDGLYYTFSKLCIEASVSGNILSCKIVYDSGNILNRVIECETITIG